MGSARRTGCDGGTCHVHPLDVESLAAEQPMQDANVQRRRIKEISSLPPAYLSPRALGRGVGAGADRLGRVRIQVLATALVDMGVVAAQESGDHRADAAPVVAKCLAREHRLELNPA